MRDTIFAGTSQFVSQPIRALRSLTPLQAAQIEAALPGGWMLDRHESYDGHLSLLIAPQAIDSASQAPCGEEAPTYLVDRDARGLNLTVLCDETPDSLGTFATVADLIRALHGAAASLEGQLAPHAA